MPSQYYVIQVFMRFKYFYKYSSIYYIQDLLVIGMLPQKY